MAEQPVNQKNFEIEIDGKKVELLVQRPSTRVQQQAQLAYARAFREAIDARVPLQTKVAKVVADEVWTTEKKQEFESLAKKLLEGEKQLAQGANSGLSKRECRDLAVAMRGYRFDARRLQAESNEAMQHTAEAYAEQAKFNFLVSACTVYGDTGKRYFTDLDDFLSRPDDDPVVRQAPRLLGNLLYGLDVDHANTLPENKFLLKCGFCNAKLQLVDPATGGLVDAEMRPVNDKGQRVNEQGEPIDEQGNALTETGEFKVEFRDWDA
jgi:hypothetical protein